VKKEMPDSSEITLFLCGDVMTGRGIDQILPHPSDPTLHESYVKDARGYVQLAENANGTIPKPADLFYIWGDALKELNRAAPDLRLINLETSITKSNDYWKGKDIHYRMNPDNIGCLTAAGIDYCSLANNHVLDWGYAGQNETLATLKKAKIGASGAGENINEAEKPAILELSGKGRILVYSYGSITSGIPYEWAAAKTRPGVKLLEKSPFQAIRNCIAAEKRAADIVVFSVHWGGNWGYDVPFEQQDLAHRLIRDAGVDVVWGHSSHHFKGIEVYDGKLILYGCGDFLNDYEGIGGYEEFRGDLSLMYFANVDTVTGKLVALRMVPTQVKRFRVNRALKPDADWIEKTLNREDKKFGTSVQRDSSGSLALSWL
jgi:poly-gamma-glutamate capsule biosynthesis protein CapA/YwtB (metallophosphatase superfamily)